MRPTYLAVLRWLFVIAVAAAVIPNGSVGRPFYYANCISFGLIAAACAFVRVDRPRQRRLVQVSLSLMLLIVGYALLQALLLDGHPFANPAWSDVIALGITERGSISVAPGETIADLPSIFVPFMALTIGLLLHQDDHAAQVLWGRLTVLGGILAIIALARHELFPDAQLFGTRARGDASLSGNFFNRNTAAAFFVLSCFASFGMVLIQVSQMRPESVLRRFETFDYFHDPKYLRAAIGGVFLLASLVALFLTQSRAGVGFGALCLGVAALIIALSQLKSLKTPTARMSFIAASLGIGSFLFVLLGGRTILRVEYSGQNDGRACVARSTLQAIQDYPLLGTGYSTFKEIFPIYRLVDCGIRGVWEQAHNSWLEGYLGFGFVFVIFTALGLWILARTIRYGFRARRRMRFVPVLVGGSLAYVCLHSLVDYPLQITGIAVYFVALVSAGLAMSTAR